MIKIAFCDDDMEVLHQMNELLDRYRVERNEDITYAAFQSPFELLTEIEKGIRPDILFLDVVMPGQNGMDVAKEIRQYDTNMKIIFLTSSPEFAVESYSVGAYFYQLKPIWEESFFRLMDAVLADVAKAGYTKILLWVFEQNAPAIAFYRKYGFAASGRKQPAFGAVEEMYVRML